jgi:Flp pilus assembly protein TadG
MPGAHRGARGQATVEFALVLPLVVLAVLLVFQALVVAQDRLLLEHAAREAARAASVDPSGNSADAAVQRVLPGARLVVQRGRGIGATVHAAVSLHCRTDLPIIGPLLPDLDLHATVTMRAER